MHTNKSINNHSYISSTTLKWMRHLIPPSSIADTLTNLLITRENQQPFILRLLEDHKLLSSISKSTSPSLYHTNKKNLRLELLFNKSTLTKIYQMRDIFLEFDEDRSRTLELAELLAMFNSNGIPITKDEIVYLFIGKPKHDHNFQHYKLTFLDFISFALNNESEEKFRRVMENIKTRVKTKTFIPMTLTQSLEYIFIKGKIKKNISTIKRCINKIDKVESNGEYVKIRKKKDIHYVLKKIGVGEDINANKICKCFSNVLTDTQDLLTKLEKDIEIEETIRKQKEKEQTTLEKIVNKVHGNVNINNIHLGKHNNSFRCNNDNNNIQKTYSGSVNNLLKGKQFAIRAIKKYQHKRNNTSLPPLSVNSFSTNSTFSNYIHNHQCLLNHRKGFSKENSKEINKLSFNKTKNSFSSQEKTGSHLHVTPKIKIRSIIFKNDHVPKELI